MVVCPIEITQRTFNREAGHANSGTTQRLRVLLKVGARACCTIGGGGGNLKFSFFSTVDWTRDPLTSQPLSLEFGPPAIQRIFRMPSYVELSGSSCVVPGLAYAVKVFVGPVRYTLKQKKKRPARSILGRRVMPPVW